jgi:hypothetical protein
MVAGAADSCRRYSLADPRKFPEGGTSKRKDDDTYDERDDPMNSDPLRDYERQAQGEESPEAAHAAASQSSVVTAIIIIMVGIALLLHQLGMLPHDFMPHIWPAVFILAGILAVINATSSKLLYGVIRGTKVGSDKVLKKDPAATVLFGVALMAVGVVLELNARGMIHVGWEVFWPLVIIGVGASMLWRHARPATGHQQDGESSEEYPFDLNFVFSGTDRQVYDKDFKGGRINAVFGGFKLDLLHADIRSGPAVLEVNAVFGGGEVRIPDSWAVEIQGSSMFGAMEDKTRRYQPDPTQPVKTLVIKGAVVFGGIVIKN